MRPPVNKPPFQFAAWLVDLDGTLYHHKLVRAMMALELGLWGRPAIRTLRTFRREQERLRRLEPACNSDPFALQIRRTAEQLSAPESAVMAVVNDWMIERPGKWLRVFRRRKLLAAITRFRTQGGRTALVSDYPARRKLASLNVESLFDAVVACGEPGGPAQLKPNPAGFLLAAEQLRTQPEHCLVIGDRDDADGGAARLAGMAFQHVSARWR